MTEGLKWLLFLNDSLDMQMHKVNSENPGDMDVLQKDGFTNTNLVKETRVTYHSAGADVVKCHIKCRRVVFMPI